MKENNVLIAISLDLYISLREHQLVQFDFSPNFASSVGGPVSNGIIRRWRQQGILFPNVVASSTCTQRHGETVSSELNKKLIRTVSDQELTPATFDPIASYSATCELAPTKIFLGSCSKFRNVRDFHCPARRFFSMCCSTIQEVMH